MSPYGAYLAGRVAHIRKDFDNASAYYKIAYQNNQDNPELINKLFLLLTSKGKIDEAVSYAEKIIKTNQKNNPRILCGGRKLFDLSFHVDTLARG